MHARLVVGCSGLFLLTLMACSASGSGGGAPVETEVTPTTPAPAPDAGTSKDAAPDTSDSAPPPKKNDCKLSEVQGVTDVAPAFVTYAPPNVAPPAMTGGILQGEYKVDKATVYLPSGTAGLADPRTSTGSVNAWAVFSGTNYRLYLKAAFDIATVAGPQTQGTDTASQGAFTVSGAAITLDHACDTAIANEADYSFTDNGSGRATILIKTPSPYGDTYLQLDAAKN